MLYSSSQVGMDVGYFTLAFFQRSLFLFLILLDIIFTLVLLYGMQLRIINSTAELNVANIIKQLILTETVNFSYPG